MGGSIDPESGAGHDGRPHPRDIGSQLTCGLAAIAGARTGPDHGDGRSPRLEPADDPNAERRTSTQVIEPSGPVRVAGNKKARLGGRARLEIGRGVGLGKFQLDPGTATREAFGKFGGPGWGQSLIQDHAEKLGRRAGLVKRGGFAELGEELVVGLDQAAEQQADRALVGIVDRKGNHERAPKLKMVMRRPPS